MSCCWVHGSWGFVVRNRIVCQVICKRAYLILILFGDSLLNDNIGGVFLQIADLSLLDHVA